MAPDLLFFLALHALSNRHPSQQFVALGNNYVRLPEVRPGRESSLVMREQDQGERPGRVDSLTLYKRKKNREFLQ